MMNKHYFIWLLVAVMTLLGSKAWADSYQIIDGLGYHLMDDTKTAEILELNDESLLPDVVIPSEVTSSSGDTYVVTTIRSGVFYDKTGLASVVVPSSVTSIGDAVFMYCTNLRKVTLSEGLETISASAFSESGIEELKLPSTVKSIGSMAFYGCSNLKKLTLNEGLETIPDNAFQNTGIEELALPSTVKSIGSSAFSGCTNLKKLTLNEGLTSIGTTGFYYASFQTLVLPTTLSSIGGGAFYVPTLKTVVATTAAPQTIDDGGAFNNSSITLLVPAESVESYKNFDGWCSGFNICPIVSEFSYDGLDYKVNDDYFGVTIVANETYSSLTSLTVPLNAQHGGVSYAVTGIADGAFANSNLATVKAESNRPVSISENVFNQYTYDNAVLVVPSSNYYLADAAWSKFKHIDEIYISDGTFMYQPINGGASLEVVANEGATYPTAITIPSEVNGVPVTAIGDGVFMMNSFQSVELPATITRIGENAFGYVRDVTILSTNPESITVYDNSFQWIDGSTLHVPLGCKDEYSSLNVWCYFYEILEILPSELVYEGLRYKVLDDESVAIAFDSSYASLTNIVVPRLIVFADRTFYVEAIEDGAFAECQDVSVVRAYSPNAIPISDNVFNSSTYENARLVVDNKDAYSSAAGWLNFSTIVNGTFSDDYLTYRYNDDATSLEVCNCNNIPESGVLEIPSQFNGLSVTAISGDAFYSCGALTSIDIPSTVTSIGNSAFACCEALTSVTLHEGLQTIGDGAFQSCGALTSIDIPSTVTSIGNSAFAGCSNLTKVTLHEGLQTIGDDVFYNCGALTSIDIPSTVTSIGKSAFAYCEALTSVTLHEGLQTIGYYAFKSCAALTSIDIPSTVTSIGESAFAYCSKLEQVNLPSGIEKIPSFCFSCAGLTSIGIPESVTEIESFAFNGCGSLASAVIGRGVKSIGYCAFDGCESLLTVYSLASVPPVLGGNAFVDRSESSNESRMRRAPGEGATLYVISSSSISDYENSAWADYFGTIAAGLPLGVDSVETGDVTIEVVDGVITVNGVAEGTPVMIYSINGSLVSCKVNSEISLPAGIYIVKVGSKAVKVAVK